MYRIVGRIRRLGGVALLSLAVINLLAAAEPEEDLKSATVLTFIRHSEWRPISTGPINVAVLARPAMVNTLRRNLEGRIVNNRAIHIVDAKAPSDLQTCHVLYIGSDHNKDVRQTLAGLQTSYALTIGESDRFLEYGGAVNLSIVDGHMSFEVNKEALDRAGVTVSSTLLRYAQVNPKAARQGRPPA